MFMINTWVKKKCEEQFVLVQQVGLHGYMDQDVDIGRMLFYLWVVPYQWSVLIKNNIMPPREHW